MTGLARLREALERAFFGAFFMASPENCHQISSSNWRQVVTSLYPDALTRTYCVPPVHFNKVPYDRTTVPGTGQSALVLHPPSSTAPVHNVAPVSQRPVLPSQYSLWTQESQPQAVPGHVQDSDLQDDFAQNHVMLNLQELGSSPPEAMFILSQLSFGNYLNQPAYAAAAAQLPLPSDLDTPTTKLSEGEFDILMIHRRYGVLIGEVKSVGRNQAALNKTQAQADADVAKRVEKAVKQLDKSETVVRHLVSDVAPGLTVRKTLFLPYVSCARLKRVLDLNHQFNQAVYQSLGAANTVEAVQMCCCSDQLSQPASYWHMTPAMLSQLSTWWQHRMACTVDTLLTDDLYLDIVARFVGPATSVTIPSHNSVRVEVRTKGQAAAELGRRLALLVLTHQQVDLLHRDRLRVCITGPPGTGKTVALVLQGLRWLRQGNDVIVISTGFENRAVSSMIRHQLQTLRGPDRKHSRKPGDVFYHTYDFYNREVDVNKALSDLLDRVKQGKLYVLLDEAFFVSSADAGPRHSRLVSELARQVGKLRLWAACIRHTSIPTALHLETLRKPLRCAPSVLRELEPAVGRYAGRVNVYSDNGIPAPGDGMCAIHLSHHGKAHTGQWPVDCAKCGQNVAVELRRLGIEMQGSCIDNSPAPLSFRDVFILTRSSELQDDITDKAGKVTSAASGIVRGLRAAGVPVCVLGQQDRRHNRTRWEEDVDDVAVAATDKVTVSRYGYVSGLERRVVVMLSARYRGDDDGYSDELVDVVDRLHAVSRCTTQLIMVDVPPDTDVTTATSCDFSGLLVVVIALVILVMTPAASTSSTTCTRVSLGNDTVTSLNTTTTASPTNTSFTTANSVLLQPQQLTPAPLPPPVPSSVPPRHNPNRHRQQHNRRYHKNRK